jgi:hypothetical protein
MNTSDHFIFSLTTKQSQSQGQGYVTTDGSVGQSDLE